MISSCGNRDHRWKKAVINMHLPGDMKNAFCHSSLCFQISMVGVRMFIIWMWTTIPVIVKNLPMKDKERI